MSAVRFTSPAMRACVGSACALLEYRVQVAYFLARPAHTAHPGGLGGLGGSFELGCLGG